MGWLLALSLAACGTTPTYPPAPLKVQASERVGKIAVLDELQIQVKDQPDLSSRVTVRPDGRISMPLVEDMPAAGRTLHELGNDIQYALSKVVQNPVVDVTLSRAADTEGQQIRVTGEAGRPQAIPYREHITVLDVMIQVGGLTDFADGNAAVLVRGGKAGQTYSLRLKDLLKRGDMSANAELLPGDIIIVPQALL
jgi:polysaccharide export outer membrane protein